MKKYYKIIDGQTLFVTNRVVIGDKQYINPPEQLLLDNDWKEYVLPKLEQTLELAIHLKIREIDAYDISDEINSFILNGETAWLSKQDRVGLMNSISVELANGHTESTLWINNSPIVMQCEDIIKLLSSLEMYAVECYNTTALHKHNVRNLQTIDEVTTYDYTINYPKKLILNVESI